MMLSSLGGPGVLGVCLVAASDFPRSPPLAHLLSHPAFNSGDSTLGLTCAVCPCATSIFGHWMLVIGFSAHLGNPISITRSE